MTKSLCFGLLGIALVSTTACIDPGADAVGTDPGSPETAKTSDAISSGSTGSPGTKVPGDNLAAAEYAAICVTHAVPAIKAVHPTGVVTWELRGGTVLEKDDFCQIGKALLWMQEDGNLVIYDENGRARWASNTVNSGNRAIFQADGNFVVYNSANVALHTGTVPSNTCCHTGYNLHVQADGNVVIYAPGWVPKWATGTNH